MFSVPLRRVVQSAIGPGSGLIGQRVARYFVKAKKKKGTSGQALFSLAGVATVLTGMGVYALGQPDEQIPGLETEPDKYANEFVVTAYCLRARDRLIDVRKSFTEPSSDKLLPDPLPAGYQRPYTVVLEMNDVLAHREYDRKTGWRYQKRPGIEAFLMQLFDFYEIVIFTTDQAYNAAPILAKLDPKQYSIYQLYRDSTKYVDGQHVKDLANLNRPLSKVIVVDANPQSVQLQPENCIILDKWTGDINDRTLWDLAAFLQVIALNDVEDVRQVLDHYKAQQIDGKSFLEAFKANQERLKAEEERLMAERTQKQVKGPISTFQFGLFGRHGQPASQQQQQQQQQQQTLPTSDHQGADIVSPPPPPLTDHSSDDSSSSPWFVPGWIGSWLGWK